MALAVLSAGGQWLLNSTAQAGRDEVLARLKVESAVADHPLTAAERAEFEQNGMLVIEAALSADEVHALDLGLEFWAGETTHGLGVRPGTTWHGMTFSKKHDAPSRHPALIKMLAHPRVLGKVAGILGWNIYMYHAHATYTRASSTKLGIVASPKPSGDHWHQDSGRVNADGIVVAVPYDAPCCLPTSSVLLPFWTQNNPPPPPPPPFHYSRTSGGRTAPTALRQGKHLPDGHHRPHRAAGLYSSVGRRNHPLPTPLART
jgi:hypothetical protein